MQGTATKMIRSAPESRTESEAKGRSEFVRMKESLEKRLKEVTAQLEPFVALIEERDALVEALRRYDGLLRTSTAEQPIKRPRSRIVSQGNVFDAVLKILRDQAGRPISIRDALTSLQAMGYLAGARYPMSHVSMVVREQIAAGLVKRVSRGCYVATDMTANKRPK